jgi:hypothetical protein
LGPEGDQAHRVRSQNAFLGCLQTGPLGPLRHGGGPRGPRGQLPGLPYPPSVSGGTTITLAQPGQRPASWATDRARLWAVVDHLGRHFEGLGGHGLDASGRPPGGTSGWTYARALGQTSLLFRLFPCNLAILSDGAAYASLGREPICRRFGGHRWTSPI